MHSDYSDPAPATFPRLERQQSPWRERRFLTQALADLLRARLAGPVATPEPADVEWTVLLAEAQRHGVGPLLTVALDRQPRTCPAEIWQGLAELHDRTAHRNGLAMIALNRVLTGFAGAQLVPPLLLKGAALLHTVYPGLALRPMQDLDLLLAPDLRRPVTSLLEEQGYQPQRFVSPSQWHEGILTEETPGVRFTTGGGQSTLRLECHLRLSEWPEVSFSDLCRHSRSIGTAAAPGRVLGPTHELLFLLLHVLEHQRPEVGGAGRLLWWFDVAACAYDMADRWGQFATLLETLPGPRQAKVRELLAAVKALFGAPIPPSLAPLLGSQQLERQSRGLWTAPARPLPDVRWLEDILRSSPRLRSPAARARFVAGYVLPPPAYLRQQYGLGGPGAFTLWYVARPFALAVKLARVLVGR